MQTKNFIDRSDILSGPLHVAVDVTNRCMAKCLHCFNRSGELLIRNELSDMEFLEIIKQIVEVKPFSICYCGGEPLMRYEALLEATRCLKSGGVAHISMVSNGFLMNQKKASELENAGITMMQFSLDGSKEETHDYMRGLKGMYRNVLAAIEAVNNTKINLTIAFSPTKFNLHQFPQVVEIAKKFNNIKSVRVQPLMPLGNAVNFEDEILPTENQYRQLVSFIENFNGSHSNFTIEWGDPIDHLRRFTQLHFDQCSFVEVKSDGLISVSAYLPLKVGNLKKHSLKEYWNNGLGKIWQIPIVQQLAEGILCIKDMGTEKSGVPSIFYEKDIIFDIIEDKTFDKLENFTLQRLTNTHSFQEIV